MTRSIQPAILAPVPAAGRFLVFQLRPGADPEASVVRLAATELEDSTVVGLGSPLVEVLRRRVPGLRPFPSMAGPGFAFPSTQGALWAFVGGADSGVTLHAALALREVLGDVFTVDEEVLAFLHAGGRDLSGFVDGTENPRAEAAALAAIVRGEAGLNGSSFVAVQRWVHDLAHFERMAPDDRDRTIGRRLSDNHELEDAPANAHVKRTAQESYAPPAFIVRRSMPYGSVAEHGLYFVAYGATLDPFERILRRMAGLEDGVTDALLRFSRPATGGYYWCPPRKDGCLDLRLLGL